MRVAERIVMSVLAALVVGLAMPSGNAAPPPEPSHQRAAAAVDVRSAPKMAAAPSQADLLATMRPILDRMAESLGLPGKASVSDAQLLENLIRGAQAPSTACPAGRHFGVLLATVPDYVDSHTAWMADEVLSAMQAAMPHEGYVLDRFDLPEVPENGAASEEKRRSSENAPPLHETRPGVFIFRGTCGWQVVLIALETATSGLHVNAFDNAARFMVLWQKRTNLSLPELTDPESTKPAYTELRIVGPTFSGSVDLMVVALERLAGEEPHLKSIRVLSGSATADINAPKFRKLCNAFPEIDCSYGSAMHSNQDTVEHLCRFLRQMNPAGVPKRVGVLQEYNTSFGMDFNPPPHIEAACAFRRYTFPLHIAQLRADARAAPELPLLLTPSAVALKLEERIRPVDLVPPMRPGVASPLTDLSIAAILDDVRHRGLTAIGIYATDVRDALFLSREVKRAAPDVQLFYPSAHRLYLHHDFVAYTRGGIVASTYPLAAIPQLWGNDLHDKTAPRETFTSTVAQGVFIATLTQVSKPFSAYLPDYPFSENAPVDRKDIVGTPHLGPKPGMWLSVIGDDGFWPLEQVPPPAGKRLPSPVLERWPRSVAVASVVLVLIIVVQAGAFIVIWSARPSDPNGEPSWMDRLRGLSVMRAFAPPADSPESGRLHRLLSTIAFIDVVCLGFWMGTVIAINHFGPVAAPWSAIWLIPVAASTIVALSPARALPHWQALPRERVRVGFGQIVLEVLVGACWALPIAALFSFVISTYWARGVPEATAMLAAARTIGGGIASPAASTVCLLAAMHVPVVWSLRRLRVLGGGYRPLARRSFTRLLGPAEGVERFTSLLDAPMRHLPWQYPAAIAMGLAVASALFLPSVATVEGSAYTVFLGSASFVALASALVLTAQSAEIWRRLRALLLAMADLPLDTALARLGMPRLGWHISIVPPDTRDLRVAVGLASELRDRMQDPSVALILEPRAGASLDEVLQADTRERNAAPIALAQSATWFHLWQLCDDLLPVVETYCWATCDKGGDRAVRGGHSSSLAACLNCCETLLASSRALVLRDVTARIMSGVFATMVVLGLLAGAHLLYVFQGRASFLTLDAAMLGVTSLAAVWILIGMERDAILSLIWHTTPGRVTFTWALVRRLVVYGVLPLLVVLGSMFPEVGETLVRVIDPLRRLTAL